MKMTKKDEKLLDHDYDGIRELDNDLPPWWLWLFYITIAFAVVYMLYYHVFDAGDLQVEAYYKEVDPNWVPPEERGPKHAGLFYQSPYHKMDKDVTPLMRKQQLIAEQQAKEKKERLEQAVAKAEGHESGGVNIGELGFDDLIRQAMKKAGPDDLKKLQSAFPEIYNSISENAGKAETKKSVEEEEEKKEQIAPLTDEASLSAGKEIFLKNCASCHGDKGQGGIGPNMTDDYWLHGAGMNNVIHTIKNGVPSKGMIAWQPILSEKEIKQVASYLLSLHGTNPPNPKKPQGEKVDYPL
jgi:cbb3-type cytochrome c oxidase subunit III